MAAANVLIDRVYPGPDEKGSVTSPNGFAVVRPPGHHAGETTVEGFCIVNTVALAARRAQRNGRARVAIVDFDVHHGNGTQDMFASDPTVLYISVHRYDRRTFYPRTGGVHETGKGAGKFYSVNVPLTATGMGDNEYALAFDAVIVPILRAWAPDALLVSAGFDAARADPVGQMNVSPLGFGYMMHRMLEVQPRTAVFLEGGYNLHALADNAVAVLDVLTRHSQPDDDAPTDWSAIFASIDTTKASPVAKKNVKAAIDAVGPHWWKVHGGVLLPCIISSPPPPPLPPPPLLRPLQVLAPPPSTSPLRCCPTNAARQETS
jgi:acetoin utilization deacetylase AcuC-like enzyme